VESSWLSAVTRGPRRPVLVWPLLAGPLFAGLLPVRLLLV
jgi:hypothetical protein